MINMYYVFSKTFCTYYQYYEQISKKKTILKCWCYIIINGVSFSSEWIFTLWQLKTQLSSHSVSKSANSFYCEVLLYNHLKTLIYAKANCHINQTKTLRKRIMELKSICYTHNKGSMIYLHFKANGIKKINIH